MRTQGNSSLSPRSCLTSDVIPTLCERHLGPRKAGRILHICVTAFLHSREDFQIVSPPVKVFLFSAHFRLSHGRRFSLCYRAALLFFLLTSSEGLLCLFPGATLFFLAGDGPGIFLFTKVVAVFFWGEADQALVREDKGFFSLDGEDETEVDGQTIFGNADVDGGGNDDEASCYSRSAFSFLISWIFSKDGSSSVQGPVAEASPLQLCGVELSLWFHKF